MFVIFRSDDGFTPPNKVQINFLLAGLTIGLIVFGSEGCGKRRPPTPPPARSLAPSNYLSAVQRGGQIRLKLTLPPELKDVKQISIYRLNESLSSPKFLSEDDYASRSNLIGVVNRLSTDSTKLLYFDDVLSNTAGASRLRYSARLIFTDGRRSALSNFLIIEPTFQVPLPPSLARLVVTQSLIHLEWSKPETNLDLTKPANVAGYNVYRIQDASSPNNAADNAKLLNSVPLTSASFNDVNFSFGNSYRYFVRAVTNSSNNSSADASNTLIESLDSNAQTVTPRDTFPPAAPQNLTIAASPGRLSLFFAANVEPDVAGYFVYRSRDEKTPLDGWLKITSTPLVANTFQDTGVESGQKYFYYLRAFDNAGNLSEPSEIISETAP